MDTALMVKLTRRVLSLVVVVLMMMLLLLDVLLRMLCRVLFVRQVIVGVRFAQGVNFRLFSVMMSLFRAAMNLFLLSLSPFDMTGRKAIRLGEILLHVREALGVNFSLHRSFPPGRHIAIASVKRTHIVYSFYDLTNGSFPELASEITTGWD